MKKFAVLSVLLGLASVSMAAGDATKGQTAAAACAACHGADGNKTTMAEYPKLAGQRANYVMKQLHDFKSGERKDPVMGAQAMSLDDQAIRDIAAFYNSIEVQYSAVPAQYIEQGQNLYRAGDAAKGIPACTACHGPQGKGLESAGFAALGGQNPQYTIKQLKAFKSGARANDASRMMRDIAAKMSDEQMEAVAYYLVGLH